MINNNSILVKESNESIDVYYIDSLNEWLDRFGFKTSLDAVYLFVVVGFGLLGLLFNYISLFILFNREFKTQRLFSYLKIYLINRLCINLYDSFLFLATIRFINFNSYISAFYLSFISPPVFNICFTYGVLLDIFILL
jgi:hypothetical protein